MSTLQVANIWFESTGNNRLQYVGSNNYLLVAGSANALSINSTAVTYLANVTYNSSALTYTANVTYTGANVVYNTTNTYYSSNTTYAANTNYLATVTANNFNVTGVANFASANVLNQTLTDGATVNWNMSNGMIASITLAGNRTIAAPTNMKVGTAMLIISQDATGSRTLTWNSVFKWPSASAPTLTTTANAKDIISFYCDGTNLYGSFLPDVR